MDIQARRGRHTGRVQAIGLQPRNGRKHGRIVVVRGQNIAQPPADHIRRTGAAQMTAAAHRIRRAQNDPIPGVTRRLEHPLVHREFGDACAMMAEEVAGFGLAVVMAEHGCRAVARQVLEVLEIDFADQGPDDEGEDIAEPLPTAEMPLRLTHGARRSH